MGFFISDESQSATDPHSLLCHSKTAWGPIFIWVLSTKYTDSESGLVYYSLRFLSPETGRWTARDPIGERGVRNLFAFCRNNTITGFDPFGLKTVIKGTEIKRYADGKMSVMDSILSTSI